MSNASRYWAHWRTTELAQARSSGHLQQTVVVLPLGATEQHGPHLPLQVDSAIADAVVAAAVARLDASVSALFLPTQYVGYSPEHAAFAGTLTLKAETVIRLWTDIAESVAASGVRRLVLFNTHGGHVGLMDVVARDLRQRLGLMVYSVNWFNLPLQGPDGADLQGLFDAREHRFGIHAGAIETSMMLAVAPEQVDMAQARDFASSAEWRAQHCPIVGNGRSAKLAWQMQDYNPAGAVGNAASARADTGRLLIDAAGRALAQLLAEVHALPADTVRTA